ncbi:MAG: hypothetical protein K2K74_04595, partial [Lachnospiraceae bacterium]|nr:hypothetical protein [Lachnospiraceae bacterium]
METQAGLANTTLTSMLDGIEAAELLKEGYDKVSLEMHEIYFKNFSTQMIFAPRRFLCTAHIRRTS